MIDSNTQRVVPPRQHQRRARSGPAWARRHMLAFAIVLGMTVITLLPTVAQADHHVTSSDIGYYGWTTLWNYSGYTCRDDGGLSGTGQLQSFTRSGSEQERITQFDGRDRYTNGDMYQFSARDPLSSDPFLICANSAATDCQGLRGWGGKGRLTRGNFLTTEGYEKVVYYLTDISWEPSVDGSVSGELLHVTGRYSATSYGYAGSGPAMPIGQGTVLFDIVLGTLPETIGAYGGPWPTSPDYCSAVKLGVQSFQFIEDPLG